MTKLYSPCGQLGYFVGYESEAMYYIYSPEKYKVYRISTARVEDSEGLDDPQDVLYLEDRVLTVDIIISDQIDSETDDKMTSDQDNSNRAIALTPEETELYIESERSDAGDDVQ